jgi:hypothetical protein
MQIFNFTLQTLGDQESLSTGGDALQSVHANDRSHRFGSRHGESRLANETRTQSSQRSHGKDEIRALIETPSTHFYSTTNLIPDKFYLFH